MGRFPGHRVNETLQRFVLAVTRPKPVRGEPEETNGAWSSRKLSRQLQVLALL